MSHLASYLLILSNIHTTARNSKSAQLDLHPPLGPPWPPLVLEDVAKQERHQPATDVPCRRSDTDEGRDQDHPTQPGANIGGKHRGDSHGLSHGKTMKFISEVKQ